MKKSLVTIRVRKGELQKALKLFKRKVEASGHLQELRERKEYLKPSVKKRLQRNKAVREHQRNLKQESNI